MRFRRSIWSVSGSYKWCSSVLGCLLCILLSARLMNCDKSESTSKIQLLKDLSGKHYVLKLNGVKFREYVKTKMRDYSFVVLFAALANHRRCTICGTVHEEFELAAKSFRMMQGGISDKLFFGSVDFDQSADVFRIMNVNSVPSIMFFPSSRNAKHDILDMQRFGYSAEVIAKWLTERSGIDFKILRPPVFFGTAGLLSLLFVGSIVIYFRCETNVGVFTNRTIWGITSIAFCLIMTSGQMWNHMRSPPFITRNPSGGVNYVLPSSHSQLIGETYMVFLLNAGIVVSVIVLIDHAYADMPFRKNKILSISCILVAALFFNAILTIFKMKASNYPYRGFL
ncbi:magnesium transporter protein 1-like isoform X3 [Planococcus citri]|uniref:magnesium transporter protein 1-like isoform X3 n=1 Tax=Planococcus citri TaxID=170843 RepID=UPI0031F75956